MGIEQRKERERRLRKEIILESAIALIHQNGFEKTTMDEIARKAELSKGTLYLYFKNKAALYQGIRKQALEQLHKAFQEILHQDVTGSQLVREMNRSFIDFINEEPVLTHSLTLDYREDLEDNNELLQECKQLEKEIIMMMTRALQIGIQDKTISTSLQPKILAIQIGLMMRGVIEFYLSEAGSAISEILRQNRVNIKTMMQQFMDTFLNQIDMQTN